MKIHNLKDLKTALAKVPDHVLAEYIIFNDIEESPNLSMGITFKNSEDLTQDDESESMERMQKNLRKYPVLSHIGKFISLCGEEAIKEDGEGYPIEYTPLSKKKRK